MPTYRVGVISDTHGLLRPAMLQAMEGCMHIIHAGDVGDPAILARLEAIAPLTVVRGNIDNQPWALSLPKSALVSIGDALIYVIHDITTMDIDPIAARLSAVVYGHSHHPSVLRQGGMLYLNPGSVGPRRFNLPVSLAILSVNGSSADAELTELNETFRLSA